MASPAASNAPAGSAEAREERHPLLLSAGRDAVVDGAESSNGPGPAPGAIPSIGDGVTVEALLDRVVPTANLSMANGVGDDLGFGGNKWSGGVLGPDGCIYGIPAKASQVLRFDPKTSASTLVGDDLGSAGYKWVGGVLGPDGCIYGIPHEASKVLRFDPKTSASTLVGDDLGSAGFKWTSGVLGPDGCIYGTLYEASQVLRFDPKTSASTLVGDDLGSGGWKWSGGVLGPDGCIYGIPSEASQVLRFDPKTSASTLVGDDLGSAGGKWGQPGGAVLGPDGCIYGIPNNASRVLRFDPKTSASTLVGDDLGSGGNKWSGGVLGPDGCIYGIPSLASQVLLYDCARCQLGRVLRCLAQVRSEEALVLALSKYSDGLLHQWRTLSETPSGANSMADALVTHHPRFVDKLLHSRLITEEVRQAVFQMDGMKAFLGRLGSLGPWLVELGQCGRASEALQYFRSVSELPADRQIALRQAMMAAEHRTLLCGCCRFNKRDLEEWLQIPFVRGLLEEKCRRPLPVTVQLIEGMLSAAILSLFVPLTWSNQEPLVSRDASRTITCLLTLNGILAAYEAVQLVAMSSVGMCRVYTSQASTWTDWLFHVGVAFIGWTMLTGAETQKYDLVVIVTAIALYLKVLHLCAVWNSKIALFLTTLQIITVSLVPFLIVFAIIMLAFVHVFRVVLGEDGSGSNQFASTSEAFVTIFRMAIGDFDRDWFRDDSAKAASLATALFVAFELLANVLMLNVLIAVVSDSFEDAQTRGRQIFLQTQLEQVALFDSLGLTTVSIPCLERAWEQLGKAQLRWFGSSDGDQVEDTDQGDAEWTGRTLEMERRVTAAMDAMEQRLQRSNAAAMDAMEQRLQRNIEAKLSKLEAAILTGRRK